MLIDRVVVMAKRVGIVVGATTAVCVAYVAVGLPVPTTEASVNAKILPISMVLTSVQTSQKTIIADLSAVQRQQLRNERFSLERALQSAAPNDRLTFQLRLGQISDEMARLDRRDKELN
jgi:hypothetical protein